MMVRIASLAACAAIIAAPLAAQPAESEADGEVDIEAIDLLFGDRTVTGGADDDGDAAVPDDEVDELDASEETGADDETGAEETADEEAGGEEDDRQPTDLERALAAYEICASEAGAALAEQGFSPEQSGREALLRCGGQRAAYVNAFYFSLLPRYPDSPEAEVRASAERLAAQTDDAIAMLVAREVADRPAPEMSDPDENAAEEDLPAEAAETDGEE